MKLKAQFYKADKNTSKTKVLFVLEYLEGCYELGKQNKLIRSETSISKFVNAGSGVC